MSDSEGVTQESVDERAAKLDEKRAKIQELKTSVHVSDAQADLELRDSQLAAEEERLDRELADLQEQADLKASAPQATNTQDAKDNMRRMLEHFKLQKAVNQKAGISATDAEVAKQVAESLGFEVADVKEAEKAEPELGVDLPIDVPVSDETPHKAAPHKAAAKAADTGKDK